MCSGQHAHGYPPRCSLTPGGAIISLFPCREGGRGDMCYARGCGARLQTGDGESARRVLPSRSCPVPKWIGSRPVTSARTTGHPRRADIRRCEVHDDRLMPRPRQERDYRRRAAIRAVSHLPDAARAWAGLRAEEGEGGAAVGEGVPARMIRWGADGCGAPTAASSSQRARRPCATSRTARSTARRGSGSQPRPIRSPAAAPLVVRPRDDDGHAGRLVNRARSA